MFEKFSILIIYAIIVLTLKCFHTNCLPIIEINNNTNGVELTIENDQSFYDISSADWLSEWVSTKECPTGSAYRIWHINVATVLGAPNHWIQHDALEFDIQCSDGSLSKYTIEFGPISGEPLVRRRFGYYKKTVRVYKDAKIEFNITELNELSTTHRNYSLQTYNSQIYSRQMFLKILDQMCAKLGFYSTVEDQELLYASDGPKVQRENFCPNNLFSYHLDKSLIFSKYCLIFLLLIIGSLILCINLYLKYKNSSDYSYLIEEQTPTRPLVNDNTNRNGIIKGKSKINTNGQTAKTNGYINKVQKERRNGVISYNTFEITKY